MLEVMLGFPLSPDNVNTNLYNELGKTKTECSCLNVDTEDLDDPDDVITGYRLYNFNELDRYFHIDPCKSINKVKLVFLKQGAGNNGITIRTLDTDDLRLEAGKDGIVKYLENIPEFMFPCVCNNYYVQLAIDADWLWDTTNDEIPADLQYVWTDMVDYYSQGDRRFLQQEAITSHEYRQYKREAPETEANNLAILKKYAGPYGSLSPQPTTGAEPANKSLMGRFGTNGFHNGDIVI